jgi:putative ABC transport system ATP-binding protein
VEVAPLYREPPAKDSDELQAALDFRDVFRIYRSSDAETVALRGLDLRIQPGEFVALFGASGSGKTTALRLAAALDEPSAGDVRVFGRSLLTLDEPARALYRGRSIAVVFQSGNVWPTLSAAGNVVLSQKLAGRAEASRRAAEAVLARFGLEHAARQRAGTLSGGEQQRVAIAAAAAREAPLVLADEPTAELDLANERLVLSALRLLRDTFGSTVVVVSHSPQVAEQADRVVELRDGRVR